VPIGSAARAAVFSLILAPLVQASGQQPPQPAQVPPCTGATPTPDIGFRYPEMVLQGHLSEIFTLCGCEYISGMTCRIEYNGARPLPREVFFKEFDESGKAAGPEVRLIYPRLEPGETGYATFRIRSGSPTRISLRGEWKGPWKNPY
jgi:hypothetical protein